MIPSAVMINADVAPEDENDQNVKYAGIDPGD